MPNSKDYSIYQELDLSLDQIKRELPRVAQAANSRLAKLEKIHARKRVFCVTRAIKRSLFERRKSFGSIRQEWDTMIAFLTSPETTLEGYRIAEMQRRFDKSGKINEDVDESNYKDLYRFLTSNIYRKNLRRELDSNQIIDDFLLKMSDKTYDYEDIMQEYKKYLDGYITEEELFAETRPKLK